MSKVVLVTGAARGIGLACAKEFGRSGYRVALHYRTDDALAQRVSSEIPESRVFKADLADPAACGELVKHVKDAFGSLDVLVNNAGITADQLITFAKPEDFDRLIATNLRPVFLLSKAASRFMIKQKGGQIINITSVVGHSGNGGQAIYAATKGGITAMTKSMAVDLAGFGIRCNCVAPGFIESDMTSVLSDDVKAKILASVPMKRLGTGAEVAHAAVFLASAGASYITGSTLHVNGGMYTS